jgi:hypothetical protein
MKSYKGTSSVASNIVSDEKRTQEKFDSSSVNIAGRTHVYSSIPLPMHGRVAGGYSHVHKIVLFNLPRFDVSVKSDFSSNSHSSMLPVFTVRLDLSMVCFSATLEVL